LALGFGLFGGPVGGYYGSEGGRSLVRSYNSMTDEERELFNEIAADALGYFLSQG